MKAEVREMESRVASSVMMAKLERLHMAPRMCLELLHAVMLPGCQTSTWIMAKGEETGHE